MKRIYRDLGLTIAAGLIAFGVCWGVNHWLLDASPAQPAASLIGDAHDHDGLHTVLHEQLGLTAEQDAQLAEIEARFAPKQRELEARIQAANRALAEAIARDQRYSPAVAAAVEEIHHAQGALQKATLDHLFSMTPVLTPAQTKTLYRLTTDALEHNP